MLEKKSSLATLTSPVRIYPQVLKNVRVKSKPEALNDADVQAAVKQVAETLGSTGRILVRESGTEPVIRVMVVGEKHKEAVDFIKVALDRSTDNVLGFGIKMGCQKNFNVIVWDEEDIPEEYRV